MIKRSLLISLSELFLIITPNHLKNAHNIFIHAVLAKNLVKGFFDIGNQFFKGVNGMDGFDNLQIISSAF